MQTNKKKAEKLTHIGLVSYYNHLPRRDRRQLKSYAAWFLHLTSSAVDNRMYGRTIWSPAELIAMQDVIDLELWRQ